MQKNIGYACKLIGVPNTAVKSCILKNATCERLTEVSAANLAALRTAVEYNNSMGIKLFRISSDIIPLASHPAVDFPWRELCADKLAQVGALIRKTKHRVSMHPGQYTVLNSPDKDVAERAVLDILYHADFLDSLGTGTEAKIVLHVGGAYGDKKSGLARFAERFADLPENARRRIILENDEHNYAIHEVHDLAARLGIPVVMDVFHHELLPPPSGTLREWLELSHATWKKRDGRQKIHYSQQLAGGKPGMHSLTINAAVFMDFYSAVIDLDFDIMLEVKDKNLSAVKCLNCSDPATRRSVLTTDWKRYKYAILEHSQAVYSRIRNLLQDDRPSALEFYTLTEMALSTPASPGSAANAAEHVWGHVKMEASEAEKKRFGTLLEKIAQPNGTAMIKRHLHKLAEKYNEPYLLESLYFHLK